jgi:hypothetical protein
MNYALKHIANARILKQIDFKLLLRFLLPRCKGLPNALLSQCRSILGFLALESPSVGPFCGRSLSVRLN